jgi:hypothetical protein
MRGDSDATEGYVVPAPLVTPVVIAKQYEHPFKHNTDLQNDDMLLYMNKINTTKNRGVLTYYRSVNTSCSTFDTRRVTLVTNLVVSLQ